MDFSVITREEFMLISKVSEDFGRFGKTERKCSRCGGDFEYYEMGSSSQTKCKTADCLEITSRGI
ncbi:MAG: hypothetical protein FWG65_09845 [Turicibacter sp.]|nr:hypothetical protein [Turicibacter sp.]